MSRTIGRSCLVAALVVAAISACGAKRDYTSGPNYSATPCAENCGGDPTCQAHCTDLHGAGGGAQPPPNLGK